MADDDTGFKYSLILNLGIGLPLFIIFGSIDIWFTLEGIQGNTSLEGNPIMRTMMDLFGLEFGLILAKALVFAIALILALAAARGIEHESPWVYWLALTPTTRRWMRKRKRRFVAYLPIHLAALAQAFAASSWIYSITKYGSLAVK